MGTKLDVLGPMTYTTLSTLTCKYLDGQKKVRKLSYTYQLFEVHFYVLFDNVQLILSLTSFRKATTEKDTQLQSFIEINCI